MSLVYGRYWDFCSSFGPILVAHILIPTWRSAGGEYDEHPLSGLLQCVHLPLTRKLLSDHFVYSKDQIQKGRYWSLVTYMFLHLDGAHLVDNAQGLILAGPATLDVLGTAGAVVTYLGAGLIAALDPTHLYDLQFERFLTMQWQIIGKTFSDVYDQWFAPFFGWGDVVWNYLPSYGTLRRRDTQQLLDWMHSGFDSVEGAASRLFSSSIAAGAAKSRRLIGASAGVSAFLAVDACASAEIVLRILTRRLFLYLRQRRHHPRLSSSSPVDDDDDSPRETILYAACHAIGTLRYFIAEVRRTYHGEGLVIDHSAHLNGMIVGVSAFVAARAFRWWRHRRRHKAPSSS